jgi:hypothetical protein
MEWNRTEILSRRLKSPKPLEIEAKIGITNLNVSSFVSAENQYVLFLDSSECSLRTDPLQSNILEDGSFFFLFW